MQLKITKENQKLSNFFFFQKKSKAKKIIAYIDDSSHLYERFDAYI